MVTDVNPEFDIGPLSWVQGEIDQSLTRALESLETFDPGSDDASPLQRARAHFRQAAGAIHMVGLDALQAYTDEIGQQLERLGSGVSKVDAAAIVALIVRACRKLQNFLAGLVRNAPLVPLSLYDEYEAMQHARGIKISHPADLFYPDLSLRFDDEGPRHTIPTAQFSYFLVKERRLYQQGLLTWLRGDGRGADAMREAAENIEVAMPQRTVRAFWWTVTALFDAVREESVANTFPLKQLLARIDLQIRRLIDGSGSVAERLRRETLYFLALSAPVSERVRQVQDHYRLKALLPVGEMSGGPVADAMAAQRLTREAQGLVAETKNLWQRLIGGQVDQYPKFRNSLQALCDKASSSMYPEMQPLFAGLLKGSDTLPVHGVPEPVAMEYATALLFAEDVFAQHGTPIAGLPGNIQAIQARIEAALANRPLPALDVPALAAFSERAQNRLLLAQVSQDIQANLRHMEQELDAFFRDNSKRAGLEGLAKDGREIGGALRILGLENADHLLSVCMAQIARYAAPETIPDHEDFELLAESLSALGFYIEALEQQRPQREELILPLLERQQKGRQPLGEASAAPAATDADAAQRQQTAPEADDVFAGAAAPAPAPSVAVEMPAEEGMTVSPEVPSIEAAVERDIARLQVLGQQLRQNPQASVVRREIERKILTLGDDAKLMGDAALIDKTKAIHDRIEVGVFSEIPALLAALPGTAAAVVAPSAEAQRLMRVDASELDAELLDIYLQEAVEVLDGVREHRALLAGHPHDHEALRAIRRAFHTLKGSGRMVGLTELGELAYDVEKIHNRLLEGGHPATPAVLTMIDVAEHDFRQWVETLIESKAVNPDPSGLYAAIDAVSREIDPAAPLLASPGTVQKKTFADLPSERMTDLAAEAVKKKPDTEPGKEAEAPAIEWETLLFLSEGGMTAQIDAPVLPAATGKRDTQAAAAVLSQDDGTVSLEIELKPGKRSFDGRCREEGGSIISFDVFDDSVLPLAEPLPVSETAAATDAKAAMPAVAVLQQDDHGEISLEIDLAALGKTPVDDRRERLRSAATVERPDGSVSLELDLKRLRSRQAGVVAKAADAVPPAISEKVRLLAAEAAELSSVTPAAVAVSPPVPVEQDAPRSQPREDAIASIPVSEDGREEVRVGEIVLSKVLFGLFTEENEQHWSVLNHEQALMRFDASYAPSPAMIRAAHTLAGAHLAVGFPDVAKVAKALELLLIDIGECRQQGGLVTSRTVPVVARAIAGLRLLTDRIRQRQAFAPAELREAEAIEAEIEALQKQIASAATQPAQSQLGAEVAGAQPVRRESPAVAEPAPTPVKPPSVPAVVSSAELPVPPVPVAAKTTEADAADAGLLSLHDEIDAQLLPLFLEEGGELHQQTGELLRRLRQSPEDGELQLKLKRSLHTFKGSARMVGAMRLGELAHRMETYLAEGAGTGEAYFEVLETDLDRIGYVFDRLRAGEVNVALPWLEDRPEEKDADPSSGDRAPTAVQTVAAALAAAWRPAEAAVPPPGPAPDEGQLRVSAAKIDRLVNEAGEIIIARTRAEGELRGLKSDLLELTNSVIRLRNHVRVIEIEAESQIQAQLEQMQGVHGDFDPLEFDRYTRLQELTRSIAEGVNDVSTVQQTLLAHLDTANVALLSQARLSRDVQQALFSVRTVPFSSVTERLYRILRMLSKELQKRANLEIEGAHHGLDRAVLEKLVGPLEHLLRNALDHGIEPPEARRAAGKPEAGEITIAVRQVGNEIVIAFSDDGAGLDPKRLRKVAADKGFLGKDETVSDAKLFELMLQPGFTTSKKVTQVSGRGVGTDIVRNEVVSLGGRVEVTSVLGRGTTFTLYLPLTVAVAQTVLIRGTQNRSWAIPVMMVEQVEHVTEAALAKMYEAGEVERRGRRYPFYYFDRLVDCGDTVPEIRRYNPVIFLRTGQGQVAIHIDQMIGNQEVVVKNAGTQLARVTGLSSATILGDGEIVLIVNPIQLSQRSHIPPLAVAPEKAVPQKQKLEEVAAKLVLIVDDSLTIRKVTSRLMTREGYAVETAKDGFEALQAVGERRPDVILLDIEMPKMDGFEFAKLMKGDAKMRDIPIIMITSRTAGKHRKRAQQLGVDAYLGKPYQEDELLEAIRKALVPAAAH